MHAWLFLVDSKLEGRTRSRGPVSYASSSDHLGPVVTEAIVWLPGLSPEIAVWRLKNPTHSRLASWPGYHRKGGWFLQVSGQTSVFICSLAIVSL